LSDLNDDVKKKLALRFSEMARLVKADLKNPKNTNYAFSKNFDKDDVMTWLSAPDRYENRLRDLSRFLYDASSHYKRLIQYFSTMLLYYYYVEPLSLKEDDDPKKVTKKYLKALDIFENMNLSHEFGKILQTIWIEDVFYGYEHETKDSYFIQKLDPDYCAVSSIEDGVLNFSFNFSYFNVKKDDLEQFPPEFRQKYSKYKGNNSLKWQELDSKKTICIKLNESIPYPIPPFAGIFEEIYDIEDYKSLKLARTELENYMILVEKIPYIKDADEANQFALDLEEAIKYHNRASQEFPEQIGSMLSPFEKVEAIYFNKKDNSLDNVAAAENSLYNSAGVSKLLFNNDNQSGAALSKSIIMDENILFHVLRQFERWINRKAKYNNLKFKIWFLDITRNNQEDVIKILKEAAQSGLPCKLMYCSAIGLSPRTSINMSIFENNILNIVDNFIPLKTSHTLSGEPGRKPIDDNKSSEEKQKTDENDGNNPDNRDY